MVTNTNVVYEAAPWGAVVRSWVFWVLCSSPFPAKQLGCDVRVVCSTKTMGIVNTKGNESVLLWYKGEGREWEKVSVHRVIKVYVFITLCTLTFSLSLHSPLYQGGTLTLPFVLTLPIVLVLHTAFTSDIMSQLLSRERGGA